MEFVQHEKVHVYELAIATKNPKYTWIAFSYTFGITLIFYLSNLYCYSNLILFSNTFQLGKVNFSNLAAKMILSVILLSMTMILLSILSVTRHLICGNNLNWLLNLDLIYETLWTGARSDLLISMLGKLNWFHLSDLITLVLYMWKWMSLFLRKILF